MRLLILLLFFAFFNSSKEEGTFYVYDVLTKDSYVQINYNSYTYGYCVYLDTNSLDSVPETIRIYATVYDGYFYDATMYYGDTNNEPNMGDSVTLYSTVISHSSSSVSYSGDRYYSEFTYYFDIPSPSSRYLFLSFPDYYGRSAEIGLYNGLPVWAIIVIVFACILVVSGIIIAIICYIKKRKPKYYSPVNPPVNTDYQPPVVTYAQPAPAYPPPSSPTPGYPPAYPPQQMQTYYS